MKWALRIAGGIVAIVAVVALIGMTLPREHVAVRAINLNAGPDSVWAALIATKSYPSWRTDVERVVDLPAVNGKRSWRESDKNSSITYIADEEVSRRRLVSRIADENLPFGGVWIYELSSAGRGTRVTITEKGWVSNPLFRFVSRFVIGQTATMDTFLRALGKRFGESVTPA